MSSEVGRIENVLYSVVFALVYISVLLVMVLIVWPFEFIIFWMSGIHDRKGSRKP